LIDEEPETPFGDDETQGLTEDPVGG